MVFDDIVRGPVTFHTDVIGDPVLVRSDGMPAYNFAVVIDDALMQVTHVVRGEDHISNTPRQVLLYEAFGWQPPAFAHLSLVMGPDHTPLSKRHGATSVAEFREKGYLPEALVNYLALIGWSPGEGEEVLPLDELARRFDLSKVAHSAGVFDEDKLAWVNRHYLKTADPRLVDDWRCRFCATPGWSSATLSRRRPRVAASTSSRRSRARSIGWRRCRSGCRRSSRSTPPSRSRSDEIRARVRVERRRAVVVAALAEELQRQPPRLVDREMFRALADAREGEDRAEGQGAVSSDSRRAHRRGRGSGARSARPGDRSRDDLSPATACRR